ncbi:hypothetical protein GXW71_21835 [Roseomonas hellenica]|uniref:Uncharacterized protein n=1 Tax=Plastoroseomonas hellenica TaxID=2687306 RepID=A0ABS5F396_9PROT|nr:hypothetical protein [Plastoroseomonas hellenica]MBR0667017.1 hypothetical protein [Plastoroseomonas hellenica]
MDEATDQADAVEHAAALAREIAPDLGAILFTHYPDADTLDTLRPGSAELGAVTAANRAAAAELTAAGVQVFVQVADKASFRRWMHSRVDSPEARLAWRDRDRLLSGDAALKTLGVDPALARPGAAPRRGSGSAADRLVRAFAEDSADFDDQALELIEAGRDGVLEVATRKLRERFGDEAAEDFAATLLALAEGAEMGPAGWAELMALPVALPPGAPPDAVSLGASLIASGVLAEALELRFLPEWRTPQALAALPPTALRRVLVDLLAGREPADLPPATPARLSEDSFGVLLALQIDWEIPLWEEILVNGLPEEDAEDDADGADGGTPEEQERLTLFDRWRSAVFETGSGCVPLALVHASEVEAEIAAFLEEAGEHSAGIEEIREFVAMGRREAGEDEVVCRLQGAGDGLEIALYTREGRFLDSITLSAEQLPASPEEMPRLIAAFVPVVDGPPG